MRTSLWAEALLLQGLVVLSVGCCDTPSPAEQPPLVLLVQPLGSVSRIHVDSIAVALEKEYGARVHIASPLSLPERAFTTVRSPRYRADTLIAWLRGLRPDTIDHIIGLTDQDISHTKYAADKTIKEPRSKYRDFGIFGLGYVKGPSCVISTFRLGDAGEQRFFDRLCKITVHEVGHNRGLPHCADEACVMRDIVERIASMDAADRSICPACLVRLREGMTKHYTISPYRST